MSLINSTNEKFKSSDPLRKQGGGWVENDDLEVDVNVVKCQINKLNCN